MIGVFARKVARVQQRRALARWHWFRLTADENYWLLNYSCECGHQWVEHSKESGRCMGLHLAGDGTVMCGCGWLDETIVADATAPA